MIASILPSIAKGTLSAPPSKSLAHRYLICAALSDGESVISPVQFSEDILATMESLRALGAEFTVKGEKVLVKGIGKNFQKGKELFCGESGSTLRFFLPLCLLNGETYTLCGAKRLFERPLSVYEDLCAGKGFFFEKKESAVTVSGKLQAGEYQVAGNVSSQFITGLLLALSLLEEDSTLLVTGKRESSSYLDLTLSVMKAFGVEIEKKENGYFIPGGQVYKAGEYRVEADLSNAAFLEAFSYLGGEVLVEGLPESSLQGDGVYREHFKALSEGFATIDLENCPDLGPVLMTFAALFHGGEFLSTARLKLKESDRGMAMAEELKKCGASILVEENRILVSPAILKAPKERLSSHNDHRIAMSLTVLLSKVGGEIEGAEAVRKSYPEFFEDMKKIGINVFFV